MSQPSGDTLSGLTDLVSFVTDVAHSLDALVEIYPPACQSLHLSGTGTRILENYIKGFYLFIFFCVSELELRLASFYQSTLISLQEQLIKFQSAAAIDAAQAAALQRKLNIARHRLVTAFRTFVSTLCLGPLLGQAGPADGADLSQGLEEFLVICTAALSERTFVGDYNARFSVREDFGLFEQAGLSADPTRKHYILDALNTEQQARSREDRVKTKSGRGREQNGQFEEMGAGALPAHLPTSAVHTK